MIETNGKFYLGRIFNQEGKTTDQPLLYDPADLTTHAVVVGMTGSGKTGLCIDLLEEAALNHIPALMIDPKGDVTNTLLHFPNLLPQDFQPWVNPDQARSRTVMEARPLRLGYGPTEIARACQFSSIRNFHSRLGCWHPHQHPGLPEGPCNTLGAK